MMITKRGDLDVGASPEQVARLATMEPGKKIGTKGVVSEAAHSHSIHHR